MKRLKTFIAAKLGTVRLSQVLEVTAAQHRDIGLFIENFTDEDIEIIEELNAINYLSEYLRNPVDREILFNDRSTILVAYLSALGSNSEEIAWVIDELDGDVMVAELPYATAEELKVYAKLEDTKKQFISIRTKAGIEQAKAEGAHIGGLREKTKLRNEQQKRLADDMADSLKVHLLKLHKEGYTLKQLADYLNEKGITTAQGKQFKPMTVKRYIDRLDLNKGR